MTVSAENLNVFPAKFVVESEVDIESVSCAFTLPIAKAKTSIRILCGKVSLFFDITFQ
jgi:hypothetical protein